MHLWSSQARSGQVRPAQVKSGQTWSFVFSAIWRAQRGEKFTFATLVRAAQRKFLVVLDWVTRFLLYLAMLRQHWVSADAKNTKVE